MLVFSLSGLAHGVPIFIKALTFLCKRYSKYRPAIANALESSGGITNGTALVAALDLLSAACPAVEALDAFL